MNPKPSAVPHAARLRGAWRARFLAAGVALAALVGAGCELKRGPGAKPIVTPAFKRYVVEQPVGLGVRSVRSGTTELRIDRAVTEEHRTVLGTEDWRMVVHAAVVNHGDAPLLEAELSDAFQIQGRSGAVWRGHVSTEGGREGGWRHREHTGEPTHVPPGGVGRVRVFALKDADKTRDDLAVLTFRGIRIEFR